MKALSRSVGCLRKIDFVEALLRTNQVVAKNLATLEEPGALGVACVSYVGPVPTFKPPNQTYHGIGYRICGAQTVRIDKPRAFPGRSGRSGMTAIVPAREESSWVSEGAHEMIHFYLAASMVGDLATEIYGADGAGVEIQEAAFHADESLARYSMIFQSRLNDPEPITVLELNSAAQLLGAEALVRTIAIGDRLHSGKPGFDAEAFRPGCRDRLQSLPVCSFVPGCDRAEPASTRDEAARFARARSPGEQQPVAEYHRSRCRFLVAKSHDVGLPAESCGHARTVPDGGWQIRAGRRNSCAVKSPVAKSHLEWTRHESASKRAAGAVRFLLSAIQRLIDECRSTCPLLIDLRRGAGTQGSCPRSHSCERRRNSSR
jgi:hypothetical protein